MLLHQPRELFVVDAEGRRARARAPASTRSKAVGRLEGERVFARDLAACCGILEELHAALERLAEALLLRSEHLPDLAPVLRELG